MWLRRKVWKRRQCEPASCRKAFSVKSRWSLKPGPGRQVPLSAVFHSVGPTRRNEPGPKALDCHEGFGRYPEGTGEPWKDLVQGKQRGTDTDGM